MKIKKKLRDLTFEEYKDWKFENCIGKDCARCAFGCVNCSWVDEDTCGGDTCWINNKDSYSDKFLNQEINIPDILDKQEKEYLRNVIKPFKNNIQYIIKQTGPDHSDTEYITTFINSITNTDWLDQEYIVVPFFKKGTMYKNMEVDKEYTLEELGL